MFSLRSLKGKVTGDVYAHIDRYFSFLSRHNDLPWNIRKFLKNQLREFRFDDLSDIHPWSRSAWSHTDLKRLKQGMVAAQVSLIITVVQEFVKVIVAAVV